MRKIRKPATLLLTIAILLSMVSISFAEELNDFLSINPIQPIQGIRDDFISGVDISTLEKVEFYGGKFFDNGVERDVLDILKERGVNWVRLKVWNDPVLDNGFSDKESVVAMAQRVKEKGFKLLLNFHYSDHWADPGKQNKPAAWVDLTFPELKNAVYDYTFEVVSDLKAVGALPDMVQIGNEINGGLLWPDGHSWDGVDVNEYGNRFDRIAQLLNSGIKAVHDAADGESVKIALHLADGHDNGLYRWWFDEITKPERNVEFDVIGLSWYPYWHGTLDQLKSNMNDISARYNKEVAVFETAYAFTLNDHDGHPNIFGPDQVVDGYPVSVQGQADLLYDVFKAVAEVPDNLGLGVFYWEPAWLGVEGAGWIVGEGNAWENQAMFDFNGEALDSLYVFGGALKPTVVGYNSINVETDVGVKPVLPSSVTAWHTDGVARELQVNWDSIEPEDYAQEGTFTVNGTVAGTVKVATATIKVKTGVTQAPVDPADPSEPADPVDPADPSEPADPVDPAEPVDSDTEPDEEPGDDEKPGDDEEPIDEEDPDDEEPADKDKEPSHKDDKVSDPKTGDKGIGIYIFLAITALAIIGINFYMINRKKLANN